MRHTIALNKWAFQIQALNYRADVIVPHTWNADESVMNYTGEAEYQTTVFVDETLSKSKVFLSFRAVYHNAKVYINHVFASEHSRSGYTPFRLDITDKILFGKQNFIQVVVNNAFAEEMLPYQKHFDWANDGGIIRKCELQFVPKSGIAHLQAEEKIETINAPFCSGTIKIKADFLDDAPHRASVQIKEYASGKTVIEKQFENLQNPVEIAFENLKLWSFDSPNLYRIAVVTDTDVYEIRTGLRKVEVAKEKILLNGKEIYLKGCEWMPGSHPDFGMAEPLEHSIKCLTQLKNAGCVFTRFHWQQDDNILDWCDENGLLVQEEIPYWGYPKEATALQLDIAGQQADEMVFYHAHHPSVIFWGVGNELGGAKRATIQYVKEMVAHFKQLDSRRLVNYVSNTLSLTENADKDDATLHGDIAMWNDYLGLWEPSSDIENHIKRTCKKAAGMPLVVSEFGLCEPHFKGGDRERARILKERLELYKKIPNIKGYVWFSLNDYRTHCGEEGEGKMRRRVHGSTDLYGNEKPSYRLLCALQED